MFTQNCNIFGGEDQCVSLPPDTSFAALCPDHDLKVGLTFICLYPGPTVL
jgi:hypothetical protein